MTRQKPLWQELRVGDRVRILDVPSEFLTPEQSYLADMVRCYRRLIARRRSVRIARVDEYGAPWIDYQFRRSDGRWEYYSTALNHGGIVRVVPRSAQRGRRS